MKKFNLQEALKRRKIVIFQNGPKLVNRELKAAQEDLQDAKDLFSRGRFKSATTIAYYAVFHASRALLYKKKYREKSHIQLAFAIKAFYVDTELLSRKYYDNFIQALELREIADYKRKFSKQSAEKNIKNAEEAIKLAESLLKNRKK